MFSEFLQYLQYEKSFSTHTVLSYRTDLLQFFAFLEVEPAAFAPDTVSANTIRQWILSLTASGVSARTISRKISTLKSFWRFLQRRAYTAQNPTKKIILPKINKPLPAFYKDSEMAAALSIEVPADSFEKNRNRLIINILWQSGMRVSELISLRDADVDDGARQIKVLGKRNKERIIPLGSAIFEEIARYKALRDEQIEKQDDAVFLLKNGKKMYSRAVYQLVRDKMSAVSTLHKQSPHTLRHTFATALLNHAADINATKELLGHSSLAATQVYTHVSFSELNKIYKQAHPRAQLKRR